MPRLFDWLNDPQRQAKIIGARLNAEFDNLFLGIREKLTANRTYYVRSDGSDSNTGLTNDSAGAWLTLDQASDTIINRLDLAGFTVTIQVGSGTYSGTDFEGFPVSGNNARIILKGDAATPANVVIAGGFTVSAGAILHAGGFKFTGNDASFYVHGSDTGNIGTLYLDYPCEFTASTNTDGSIKAASGGQIFLNTDFLISGSHDTFLSINMGGLVQFFGAARTVTLTGTPNWGTVFVETEFGGGFRCGGQTFTGAATGKRFLIANNSWIDTGGAGLTYLPGDVAGTVVEGGAYDNYTYAEFLSLAGNVVVGIAALATNATDGFLYVPTCAGTPTGTPTAYTGMAPIVVNTTNNKLYFYSGGAWRDAGP